MIATQTGVMADTVSTTVDTTVAKSLQRADSLLRAALDQQTSSEKMEAAKLGRMMNDPAGKAFTFAMVDEVFRSRSPYKTAARYGASLNNSVHRSTCLGWTDS